MILEDICDVYSGYAIKQFNEDKIGVPVIKIGNILMDGTIELEDCQYTTEKVNQKYYSEYQDIYIALSGATTGKIGILKRQDKFIVNQRVGIVRKKDNNIPIEFIKYFLFHHTDRIFKEAAGCAQPNISPKQIGKYKVPIIDDSRMKYVVEILDSLTRIINKRKRQLNYLDELIKARFVEMFGDPVRNTKMWHTEKLYVIAPINKYKGNVDVIDGKVWLLNLDMIESCTGNILGILYEYENRITSSTIKFDENCVLYSKLRPYLNKVVIPKMRGYATSELISMSAENINKYFLANLLRQDSFVDFSNSTSYGAKMPRASMDTIKNFDVIMPPIELQNQFATFVHQVNKSKVEVKKALDEAQLLFDSLMQKYFG